MDEIKLIKIQNPCNRQDRIEELVDYHYENLQVIRDSYFPKDVDVVVSVDGDGSLDSESCGSLCGHVIEDCVCDGDVASVSYPDGVSGVVYY